MNDEEANRNHRDNSDDDGNVEEDEDIQLKYIGYPMLISYDPNWSCSRMKYHIYLNTLHFFQHPSSPSSASTSALATSTPGDEDEDSSSIENYLAKSLEAIQSTNMSRLFELSNVFDIGLVDSTGKPNYSTSFKKRLTEYTSAKKVFVSSGDGVVGKFPSYMEWLDSHGYDGLDQELGSLLESSKTMKIQEWTGDISKFYLNGLICFTYDIYEPMASKIVAMKKVCAFISYTVLCLLCRPALLRQAWLCVFCLFVCLSSITFKTHFLTYFSPFFFIFPVVSHFFRLILNSLRAMISPSVPSQVFGPSHPPLLPHPPTTTTS